MKFDQVEYNVGSHFLSYLINADATGLEDDELRTIEAFERGVTAERGGEGTWITLDDSRNEFGRCDVTNLHGDVEGVAYMFPLIDSEG